MVAFSELSFTVVPFEEGGALEIEPVVDGRPLSEVIAEFEGARGWTPDGGYGGLVPGLIRLGPAVEYWFGAGSPEGRLFVLGCECGEMACWPLAVQLISSGDTITWQNFEQPHRPERDYSLISPLVFDRAAYLAAVLSVAPSFEPPSA
ncbi:MAG: hypothetical protein JWR01_1369 [Subtercola sp.]|nr:hypothetical protein [Subtercola sp.]